MLVESLPAVETAHANDSLAVVVGGALLEKELCVVLVCPKLLRPWPESGNDIIEWI